MPNSDLLPISDFLAVLLHVLFNCDPYPIHVFTLPYHLKHRVCVVVIYRPPHVLPPENNM